MKYKPLIVGIVCGVVYGLIARLLIEFNENDFLRSMSIAFIFITPAIIGGLTVYFGNEQQKDSLFFQIFMPWVSIATLLLVMMVIDLEEAACVVMLSPMFLIAASIGGLIVGGIKKRSSSPKKLSLLLLLPVLIGSVEEQFSNPEQVNKVTTSIIIKADKQTVWEQIKTVETIKDEELKWSFAHFIGMPKPISSKLNGEHVGGVRNICWDKGIKFREIINDWQPLQRFSYKVIIDSIPRDAVDRHIEVGGKYFSVHSGGYELTEINAQTTRLTLHCNYSIASKFNFYGKYWADLILDDFQVVILNVVKQRCEAK